MAITSSTGLWELLKHLRQWLTNLRRASHERKQESVAALRAVIVAARQTQVYLRQLRDDGKPDHHKEEALTKLWTTLGFRLADLKLTKLSKRCDITGRYWADPSRFDNDFLEKADIGLDRMEKLALLLVNDSTK